MTKRLLITIGVHAPQNMDILPGVDAIVQRMADYARNNPTYDDPIIFSDDGSKRVTADDIRVELTEDVLKDRPRIMVHFCGHGALLSGTEIWYLDDGLQQWDDRVDVMAFRDMLLSYGAKQVSIFSDACQTPAVASGGGTPVIPKSNRQRNSHDLDMFRATIVGKAAYAPASGPLFSQTVLDVLDQDPPPQAALDAQYAAMGQTIVSSRSLSKFVRDELPDLAAGVHKTQYAQMVPGLMYDKDDYVVVAHPAHDPDTDDPGPPAFAPSTTNPSGIPTTPSADPSNMRATRYWRNTLPDDIDQRMNDSLSEWRQGFWSEAAIVAERELAYGNLIVCAHHHSSATYVGLHVPGGKIIDGISVESPFSSSDNYFVFDVWEEKYEELMHPAGVLQVGDQFVPLQLNVSRYLSMILSVRSFNPPDGAFGSDALGWFEVGFGGEVPTKLHPMQALKGLVTGVLGPESIGVVAAELRRRKHSDPLYGIVAAYLYDRIGDTDSIQRMCSYYAEYRQKIPFDVAMLSRLPFRKSASGFEMDVPEISEDVVAKDEDLPEFTWAYMNAVDGLAVSGFAPVLAMGWGRMASLLEMSPLMSQIADMRQHFSTTPYPACIGHQNGNEMIALMNAFYND